MSASRIYAQKITEKKGKGKEKGEKEYRILHWRTFGIEPRLTPSGQARNVEHRREGLLIYYLLLIREICVIRDRLGDRYYGRCVVMLGM